jgi:hypothetical protein
MTKKEIFKKSSNLNLKPFDLRCYYSKHYRNNARAMLQYCRGIVEAIVIPEVLQRTTQSWIWLTSTVL